MLKENVNYKMIDSLLTHPDIFAQDAATKLIVTVQEIKKLLNKNPSRKFEDLSKELTSELKKLVAHLVYIQEITVIDTIFTRTTKPFMKNVTEEMLRNATLDELFGIYDGFCENLDIDSYNLQVKKIISTTPPDRK